VKELDSPMNSLTLRIGCLYVVMQRCILDVALLSGSSMSCYTEAAKYALVATDWTVSTFNGIPRQTGAGVCVWR